MNEVTCSRSKSMLHEELCRKFEVNTRPRQFELALHTGMTAGAHDVESNSFGG